MSERPRDRQELEVLDLDTCWFLLSRSAVGRVAFVSGGEPMILPVNHVLHGHTVAFRVAEGAKLDAAVRRHPVAFEVDDYDLVFRSGWSVLVRGTADVEVDDAVLAELEAHDLVPWADGTERAHWIRIHPTEISGRRIPRGLQIPTGLAPPMVPRGSGRSAFGGGPGAS